jgi:hypothetical protein
LRAFNPAKTILPRRATVSANVNHPDFGGGHGLGGSTWPRLPAAFAFAHLARALGASFALAAALNFFHLMGGLETFAPLPLIFAHRIALALARFLMSLRL